jgi:hypothetical protein
MRRTPSPRPHLSFCRRFSAAAGQGAVNREQLISAESHVPLQERIEILINGLVELRCRR